MKINFSIIFCLLFIKTPEYFAHTGKCHYYDSFFYAHYTRVSTYTCKTKLINLQNIRQITSIDGIHEENRNYEDVKYLQIASDNSYVQDFTSVFCTTFPNLKGIHVDSLKIN